MNQSEKDKLTDLVNQMMAVIKAEQIPAILQPNPNPTPTPQPEVVVPNPTIHDSEESDFWLNFNALKAAGGDAVSYNYAVASGHHELLQKVLKLDEYHMIINMYSPGGTGYYMSAINGDEFLIETANGHSEFKLPVSGATNYLAAFIIKRR